MPTAASSPTMIGRDAELSALLRAFDDGRAGHPRAVVVRGEAGIGKTRLIEEFRAAVAERVRPGDPRLVVALGQCVDMGAAGTPFTPIRRLLRDLLHGVGDDEFSRAARTDAILATLAAVVPELTPSAGPAASPSPDMFAEAVETIIEDLSADHHLLLILEDLHWADAATLSLLKTLATTLRGRHVTMVCTYRSDDIDRFHPLRPVIAELDRNRAVVGIDLRRLTLQEVAEQAARIIGVSSMSAAELSERSGGIPFLVEELLGLRDGALPDTLRDLVIARYERLTPETQEIMRIVAAGGVHVDHEVLLRVCDAKPAALDAALREAIAEKVLVGDGDGYTFRHALTQEAVHDDLLASERTRFHARYAEALEALRAEGRPSSTSEIAHHWRLARDPRKALITAIAALDEARDGGAVAALPELADAIADLWPQVPDAEQLAGRGLWAVLSDASAALRSMADDVRGIRLADEALSVCPPEDYRVRARLLLNKSAHEINAGVGRDENLLPEAQRLLEGKDEPADQALLARVLAARAEDPRTPVDDAEALSERALQLAREHGSPDDVTTALISVANLLVGQDRPLEAVEQYREAQSLVRERFLQQRAMLGLIDTACFLGQYREAIADGERAARQLRDIGAERGFGSYITANVIEATVLAGRPERALELAPRTLTLITSPGWRSYVTRCVMGHYAWNDDRAGVEKTAALAREIGKTDWEEAVGWARVTIERLLGEAIDASDDTERRALLGEALAEMSVFTDSETTEMPNLRRPAIPAIARLIAAVRRAGMVVDPAIEAELEASLAALPDVPIARVWRALAAAESAPTDESADAWARAVDVLDEVGAPAWFLPYALFRLGEARFASGERDAAASALSRAVAIAPGVGVSIVARWSREFAARTGVALDGEEPAQAWARSGDGGIGALTPREQQVLGLVAQGLTNPQIGQQLFISPKTASVHVSAILAKIGASSRAEAAALYAAQPDGAAPTE